MQKVGESLSKLFNENIAALFQTLVLQTIFKDSGALMNISGGEILNFQKMRQARKFFKITKVTILPDTRVRFSAMHS